MATLTYSPQLTARSTWDWQANENSAAEEERDRTLSISGLQGRVLHEFQLGAAETKDVVLNGAVAVRIESEDYPFSLLLRVGQLQMDNIRRFELVGDDEDEDVMAGGTIRLIGNGTNPAKVRIIEITTPS